MSEVHDELEHEYEDLQSRLGDPDLIADQAAYARAAKRYNELEQIVECIRGLRQAHDDVATAKEMLTDASGDDRDMLRDEVDTAEATIVELDARLRELLLPKDPNDDKNVIVEIRGAEGGEEANLFAPGPVRHVRRLCHAPGVDARDDGRSRVRHGWLDRRDLHAQG